MDSTDVSKTTVYCHLQTLAGHGYLVKQGDTCHLSFQFLEFVSAVQEREFGYSMGKQKVREVAEEPDELVQFTIEQHHRALFMCREIGEKGIQLAPKLEQPLHMRVLAGGRAILAQWPDEEIADYIDYTGLKSPSTNTITGPDEFFEEIETIREAGYALNDQESTKNLRAVAVPINKPNGDVPGTLAVSALTKRMQKEWCRNDIPNFLKGVANEVELNITII